MSAPSLQATFWGTRGSIATPGPHTARYGGQTPCVSVESEDDLVILDAGTGLRPLGKHLATQNRKPTYHIFLSHTHWDHIQGIPFFQPAYQPESVICFHGSPQKEQLLQNILTGQMAASYFPVQMSDLPARIEICEMHASSLSIGNLQIYCEEQHYHPGGSLRFRISNGSKSLVYASDVEIDIPIQASAGTEDAARAEQYHACIANADLLIADAPYTRASYTTKRGWGHSTVETVVETARAAGVKRLALFHHDPDLDDDTLAAREAETQRMAPDLDLFLARDGMTVQL